MRNICVPVLRGSCEFYAYTAKQLLEILDLGCGTGLELEDYLPSIPMSMLQAMAQNITDHAFYHYDTPLTVEHETDILRAAGFANVEVLKNWAATYTLRADR